MKKELIVFETENKKPGNRPLESIEKLNAYKILKSVQNPPLIRETIGKIVSSLYFVYDDEKVTDLAQDLDKNKEIQALGVIDRQGQIKGIIVRNELFSLLGKPYGYDIVRHKTISKFIKTAVMFSYENSILTVAEEMKQALNSKDTEYYILFREGKKYAGVFSSIDMMIYLSFMTQRDIQLARTLQQKIVKEDYFIKNEYFQFCGASRMAKDIGGDYYHMINYDEGKWLITICDVCGKGVAASLVSTSISGMLSVYNFKNGFDAFISKFNQYILNTFEFVTAVFIDFNKKDGSLKLYDMGHSYIYLFKTGKLYRLKSGSDNLPLGVRAEISPRADSLKLSKGDMLIMITDGIIEEINESGEEFGEKRLYQIIKNYQSTDITKIKEILLQTVSSYRGHLPQHDDLTILLLNYK